MLLMLGKLALDARTFAPAMRIGSPQYLRIDTVLLNHDAVALPIGFEASVVGVGVVAFVGGNFLRLPVNQRLENLTVSHIARRDRKRRERTDRTALGRLSGVL